VPHQLCHGVPPKVTEEYRNHTRMIYNKKIATHIITSKRSKWQAPKNMRNEDQVGVQSENSKSGGKFEN
jgi:hypothetical protein